MKKVLAFSFFPAFVPPSNGGQSRLFNFYNELSEFFDVILLTSTHGGIQEEIINHGLNFIERRIPKDHFFTEQWATLSEFSGGGDLSGPCIAACGKYPTLLHQAYLEEYENADVIIHDSPFTEGYDLFAGVDNKFRIYNAYNCESKLYEQLHPGQNSLILHQIVHQAELRLLQSVDLLLHCSQEDLTSLREIAPDAKFDSFSTPNGTSISTTQVRTNKTKGGAFTTIFMGSGHPPNVRAANFIVHTLAPHLPGITFDLIGSCLPDGKYPRNVNRHGVVSDEAKNHLLSRADLALNPMDLGSGSNVKVLDYFAYELPVLSTSFGMRGIQAKAGEEFLEASLEHFAEAIQTASTDPKTLSVIGSAGYALTLAQYTWKVIARTAAQKIGELVERKAGTPSENFVLALNDYDSFQTVGGGGTRTRGLYAAVQEWSPVVFICFSENGTLQARKVTKNLTVINIPMSPEHLAEIQGTNALFHISANDIIASRQCLSNPFLTEIYRLLRRSARCIVSEHCYLAALPRAWGDRFVYSSHNNETDLKSRLLEWHPLKVELLQEVEAIERFAVESSAATITVSLEDGESLVRAKATAGPVIVVRNGAAKPETSGTVLPVIIKDRSVVFLGSAHMPNIEAAQYITERLAPDCNDIEFHLIGSVCSAIQSVPANIHLWGVVDDITKGAIMQSCGLAVNPMLSGSGSNVKLADYLGNGLFVVSTDFGQRGYPPSIREHVQVTSVERFAEVIKSIMSQPELLSAQARERRRALFDRELAMEGLAKLFVTTLKGLEVKKKRVLYVAYRYTSPAQGGAEVNIEKFVNALGHCGQFDIDVVAPEISGIHNHMRFSETYTFNPQCGAPVNIPNVRFARFPIDTPDPAIIARCLEGAWRVQPRFERAVSHRLSKQYVTTGLTWGWGYPEGEKGSETRWVFAECGVFLINSGQIQIDGFTPTPSVITARTPNGIMAGPWTVKGKFVLEFAAEAGDVTFSTSALRQRHDPRPLGFLINSLKIAGQNIQLKNPTLIQQHLPGLTAETAFKILDEASEETRVAQNVRLTDGRGPWSARLESFIAKNIAEYDLVITHNNIFKPAVVALAEANKHGVPSILIPHPHMDDDFYHFPDLLESARNASLVLAVPHAACDFFKSKGCNTGYMPAGCDTHEEFSQSDIQSFQQIYSSNKPFTLVLGRKAGAKGYQKVIDAVEQLNQEGIDLHVVIIGPDDDGVPVNSPIASYLGRQPRDVVRGALMSCVALCNMSSSESFGIVLLEAWLAGKPVVANKNCAAFHDMAIDRENALMVSEGNLAEALREIICDTALRDRLAESGRTTCTRFDWSEVTSNFVQICMDLCHTN